MSPGSKLSPPRKSVAAGSPGAGAAPKPVVQRILLTGASGALGRSLTHLLEPQPENILFLPSRSDWERLRPYAESARPDIVIHSAACGLRYPKPTYAEMAALNTEATLRLFDATPGAHFIYISTGLAYLPQGRPLTEDDPLGSLDAYASTKAAADLMLRSAASAAGRRLTVVRPFSFSGLHDGGGRLFPSLLEAAERGAPFPMSPGRQVRDYCAVQDVAAAICAIARRPGRGLIEVFNIGTGSARPLAELVEHVCRALGLRVELRLGDRGYAPHEPMHLVADPSRAHGELGWRPQVDFAHAVWELARSSFPTLKVSRPRCNPS